MSIYRPEFPYAQVINQLKRRRQNVAMFTRKAALINDNDPRIAKPVTWVTPLEKKLVKLVYETKDWSKVSPRELEQIVAEVFDGFGYEVELTKQTRDGGYDIIAIKHSNIKSDKYLIECKHWREKVNISVVRHLLGVGKTEPNSGLILVSTSGFTRDSLLLGKKKEERWQLSLKDKEAIESWILEYAKAQGWHNK